MSSSMPSPRASRTSFSGGSPDHSMKVLTAMLADYALAHEDGKLYVTGGGITSLPFDQFPATQKRLALALSIELSRSEFDRAHELRIITEGPSSPPLGPRAFQFSRKSSAPENDFETVNFVSSMDDVVFDAPGTYSFNVRIDDQKLATVRVKVQRKVAPAESEPAPATESASLLNAGFKAFAAGDIASAEDLFRRAIAALPTWAPPHNNLGFALLLRGAADEALHEFEQALRFGYDQNEITEANVGCALYLSGQYERAQAKFAECLQTRGLKGPSILYGIDRDSLFIEHVGSASEYSALMSINAAWSAKRAGDDAAAQQYRNVAEATATTVSLSPAFHTSLSTLNASGNKDLPPRPRSSIKSAARPRPKKLPR
jgi:tetratricopeptide (TPR) repeat protein